MKRKPIQSPFHRLWMPVFLLAFLIAFGSTLYHLMGLGDFSWRACIYQTLITITTVGFGDVLGVHDSWGLIAITAVLAFSGIAIATYSASVMTAAIVEGDLANYFKERKMEKLAAKLNGHTILCGAGETGVHIIEEFTRAGRPLVVIEHVVERAAHLQAQYPDIVVLTGDATEEEMLEAAGVERAAQLITTLHEDRDNMFLVVTARSLAPKLVIISKCVDPHRLSRFEKAGANFVVSPNQIGGMRMASHALRPQVVNFLDMMLKSAGETVRVDEVVLSRGSTLCGKTLGAADLFKMAGVRVIGGQTTRDAELLYNLPDDWPLQPGAVLFFIAARGQNQKMKALAEVE